MGLFSRKQEPVQNEIVVEELYYDNVISKVSVSFSPDFEFGKTLVPYMQKLARFTHELQIGSESLESILRKSDCFNTSYYKIADFRIIKCDGIHLVDEVFIALRGQHNYDVRYKVSYYCPIELIPVWYKDYDKGKERIIVPDDQALWETICELNHSNGNTI